MSEGSKKTVFIGSAIAVAGIVVGFLIGWFSHVAEPLPSWTATVENQLKDVDEATILRYVDSVNSENIRNNLM